MTLDSIFNDVYLYSPSPLTPVSKMVRFYLHFFFGENKFFLSWNLQFTKLLRKHGFDT